VEEYGDVLESLYTLGEMNGITISEIDAARREKRDRKGGFQKGIFWTPQ
jgi:predicted house-cleaning noncanonical NTP pyrophosphatase (MazG superfamily)